MKLVSAFLLACFLGWSGCGLPAKVRAGYCARPGCFSEYHQPYSVCRWCGYCSEHCFSGPTKGMNP